MSEVSEGAAHPTARQAGRELPRPAEHPHLQQVTWRRLAGIIQS